MLVNVAEKSRNGLLALGVGQNSDKRVRDSGPKLLEKCTAHKWIVQRLLRVDGLENLDILPKFMMQSLNLAPPLHVSLNRLGVTLLIDWGR